MGTHQAIRQAPNESLESDRGHEGGTTAVLAKAEVERGMSERPLDIYTITEESKLSEVVDALMISVPHCGVCGIAIRNHLEDKTTNIVFCAKGHKNRLVPHTVMHNP
jgi:hypothetical protein